MDHRYSLLPDQQSAGATSSSTPPQLSTSLHPPLPLHPSAAAIASASNPVMLAPPSGTMLPHQQQPQLLPSNLFYSANTTAAASSGMLAHPPPPQSQPSFVGQSVGMPQFGHSLVDTQQPPPPQQQQQQFYQPPVTASFGLADFSSNVPGSPTGPLYGNGSINGSFSSASGGLMIPGSTGDINPQLFNTAHADTNQSASSSSNQSQNPPGANPFKRFRNAFIFYVNEQRKRRADEAIVKNRDFLKLMSAEWKQMTEAEKQPYYQMAQEDRDRYETDQGRHGRFVPKPRGANLKPGDPRLFGMMAAAASMGVGGPMFFNNPAAAAAAAAAANVFLGAGTGGGDEYGGYGAGMNQYGYYGSMPPPPPPQQQQQQIQQSTPLGNSSGGGGYANTYQQQPQPMPQSPPAYQSFHGYNPLVGSAAVMPPTQTLTAGYTFADITANSHISTILDTNTAAGLGMNSDNAGYSNIGGTFGMVDSVSSVTPALQTSDSGVSAGLAGINNNGINSGSSSGGVGFLSNLRGSSGGSSISGESSFLPLKSNDGLTGVASSSTAASAASLLAAAAAAATASSNANSVAEGTSDIHQAAAANQVLSGAASTAAGSSTSISRSAMIVAAAAAAAAAATANSNSNSNSLNRKRAHTTASTIATASNNLTPASGVAGLPAYLANPSSAALLASVGGAGAGPGSTSVTSGAGALHVNGAEVDSAVFVAAALTSPSLQLLPSSASASTSAITSAGGIDLPVNVAANHTGFITSSAAPLLFEGSQSSLAASAIPVTAITAASSGALSPNLGDLIQSPASSLARQMLTSMQLGFSSPLAAVSVVPPVTMSSASVMASDSSVPAFVQLDSFTTNTTAAATVCTTDTAIAATTKMGGQVDSGIASANSSLDCASSIAIRDVNNPASSAIEPLKTVKSNGSTPPPLYAQSGTIATNGTSSNSNDNSNGSSGTASVVGGGQVRGFRSPSNASLDVGFHPYQRPRQSSTASQHSQHNQYLSVRASSPLRRRSSLATDCLEQQQQQQQLRSDSTASIASLLTGLAQSELLIQPPPPQLPPQMPQLPPSSSSSSSVANHSILSGIPPTVTSKLQSASGSR
ncbi:hypothetical protein GQ42DRAFT_168465 [Ramicandelaber brevisporus]|nr:hypothetical protein GQ42DRAFT_168465 [Ramicandelaber brevisporus]